MDCGYTQIYVAFRELNFENISYRLPDKRVLLDQLNLKVEGGTDRGAILGRSGSGKDHPAAPGKPHA